MPGIPPEPTPEQFEQIASTIDRSARVASTRRLAGGMSCRMDVLDIEVNSSNLSVIVRQYEDDPLREDDRRNHLETATLELLANHQVLAPRVVLDETITGRILGRPAITISYLDARSGIRPERPEQWATQLAQAIAEVHAIDLPDGIRSILRPGYSDAESWMNARNPPPRFTDHEHGTELWTAMKQMWPEVDTSAKKLIHADFWNGNTVWKDDKLVAITDWEMPAIGNPMIDVGYILSDFAYIELDVEQAFCNAYEKSSGLAARDVLFWKMAAASRMLSDPAGWALTESDLGLRSMTVREREHHHSAFFEILLS